MVLQSENISRAVAERVIRAREDAGLQKNELAEHLGLSKSGYTSYEKFEVPFTVEQLFQLERILERPVSYFLGLPTGMTSDEEQLLTAYRQIPQKAARQAALGMVLPILRRMRWTFLAWITDQRGASGVAAAQDLSHDEMPAGADAELLADIQEMIRYLDQATPGQRADFRQVLEQLVQRRKSSASTR